MNETIHIYSIDEFSRKVIFHDRLTRLFFGFVGFFLIALAFNSVSCAIVIFKYEILIQYWWDVFISVDGEQDKDSIFLVLYMIGIFVFGPIAIILFIIDKMTRSKRVANLYEKYLTAGQDVYIAKTNFMLKKPKAPLNIICANKLTLQESVNTINQEISNLPKKALSELHKKMLKTRYC